MLKAHSLGLSLTTTAMGSLLLNLESLATMSFARTSIIS